MLTIRQILGVQAKNIKATILFVDFSKAFDSIHRRKREQIFLTYCLLKETVPAIIMQYKNTKVKVRSTHRDINIVAGVLQGDTLSLYLFIIYLECVLRTSIDLRKENSFKLANERSRRYPAKIITDAEYADYIALMANAPAQAESLLHSLEQATGAISLHVNVCALIKEATFPH